MNSYICPRCGRVFCDPAREKFRGDSWDACPHCGDPDFEEAGTCKGCGEELPYSKLIAGYYCPDCVEEAARDAETARDYLALDDVRENFAEYLAEIHWRAKQ